MGMIEQAQADVKRIRTDPRGFTKSMVFTKKDGSQTATIYGMHAKINQTMDTMGNIINGKKAHISIAEEALTDRGYTVRDGNSEVALIGDRVSVADSTGVVREYEIRETIPDQTVGLIVCFLFEFE